MASMSLVLENKDILGFMQEITSIHFFKYLLTVSPQEAIIS